MKNFIKTLALVIMAIMLTMSFVGCGDDPQASSSGSSSSSGSDSSSSSGETINVYLTTIGQGDIDIAETLMNNAGYYTEDGIAEEELEAGDYTGKFIKNNLLEASDIPAGATVFVVVGTSGKGLGAAGVDQSKEETRATEFAAKTGVNFYVLHLGEKERRGDTSDGIITTIAPIGIKTFVVDKDCNDETVAAKDKTGGNYDGLFTTLCTGEGQLVIVDAISKITTQITSILA